MNADLAALLYLLFSSSRSRLALRGLSSPETSRQGNTFGMIGMAIAIGTTLVARRAGWDDMGDHRCWPSRLVAA